MSKFTQVAFNGGEQSEFIDSRVDTEKRQKGCLRMENLSPYPFGNMVACPGTEFAGEAKFSDRKARLEPFVFSSEDTGVMEIGHEYIRFWRGRVLVGDEIATPYQEEDLFEIQFEQVNDLVYVTHDQYRFRKIIRTSPTQLTIQEVDFAGEFNYPPLDAKNTKQADTIATAGTFDTKGEAVTMTAPAGLFDPLDVDSCYQVGHFRDRSDISLNLSAASDPANRTSTPLYVLGDWTFNTRGIFRGDLVLEESEDKVTWRTRRSFTDLNGEQAQANATGSEIFPLWFRIRVTVFTGVNNDAPPFANFEANNSFVPGLVKILTVNGDGSSATGTVIEPLHSGDATYHWRRQQWSDRAGWPRSLTFHKNRLCLAGRDIFISQSDNYENFRERNDAEAGFKIALRHRGSSVVQWMESQRELRVGSNLSEAVIIQENNTEAFSYSNHAVRWDSNYGSARLRAEPVNGTVFYVQPEGRTVRFQLITGIEDYYDSNSLVSFADHILGNGVTQIAYQRQRYPTFHALRKDGELASCLYEQAQNIQAWYRRTTDGEIESIAVTPRPDEEDEICFVVRREINGGVKRYVEFVALNQHRIMQEYEDDETKAADLWFLDSAKLTAGEDLETITGLEHLEGKLVGVLVDGAEHPKQTVTDGQISLERPAQKVLVGLTYPFQFRSNTLEFQSTQGKAKSISGIIVRLWRSGLARIGVNEGRKNNLVGPRTGFDQAPRLQTGDSETVNVGHDWSRNTYIEIEGEGPLPLNISAITAEFEIGR